MNAGNLERLPALTDDDECSPKVTTKKPRKNDE